MSMETGKSTGESHYACREIVAERDALAARLAEAERLLREIADDQDDRVSPGLRIAAQQFLATVSATVSTDV